jgi:hypothetical protein
MDRHERSIRLIRRSRYAMHPTSPYIHRDSPSQPHAREEFTVWKVLASTKTKALAVNRETTQFG